MSQTPAVTEKKSDLARASTVVRRYLPATDIFETPTELVAVLEMPGVGKDALDVEYKEKILTVEGRVSSSTREGSNNLWREYHEGHFNRTFNVRQEIDAEKVSASYEDGVLTIRLPKAAAAISRKIAIESN